MATLVVGWAPPNEAFHVQGPKTDNGNYLARTYTADKQTMPYRLFVPKAYNSRREYPLVVWLSGVGGRGTDNLQQISGDQVPGTRLWVKAENQAEHPAFVVAPQSRLGWSVGHEDAALQPDSRPVLGILDALGSEFSIDRQRIYLVGQSNGAGAAWNLLTNAPDRFAAAVLVAPAIGNNAGASDVSRTPIWVIQGDQYSGAARALVNDMKLAGGNPRLTEYPGVGHDSWTRAFAEPDLVSWLFNQHR
jgi:predicted peptidase